MSWASPDGTMARQIQAHSEPDQTGIVRPDRQAGEQSMGIGQT